MNAEDMVLIADRYATAHMVGSHDYTHPLRGLRRIGAVGFGDEAGFRDPAVHQVVVAHLPLVKTGVIRRAPRRNDRWSQAALIKLESMIEARAKYRRRAPRIFGRAEDNDGVSGV